eukprot:2791261-Heterocapsa_arctica.AAC.1
MPPLRPAGRPLGPALRPARAGLSARRCVDARAAFTHSLSRQRRSAASAWRRPGAPPRSRTSRTRRT